MIKYVYSLLDTKAKLWSNPFYQLSDVLAMRDLSRAVNHSESELFHNPEDFLLYCLGQFDDEMGNLTCGVPTLITNAAELKKPE